MGFTIGAGLLMPAFAFVVTVPAGTRLLYMQVGDGGITTPIQSGGTYKSGGSIYVVSGTVPSGSVGNSVAVPMVADKSHINSGWDNYAFCVNSPREVHLAAAYRVPAGATSTATLQVNTPTNLTNGTATIPFSQISWVNSGAGDTTFGLANGAFTGGTQTLRSIASRQWVETCLTFSYANQAMVGAGTFTGRATYTLSAP